MKKILSLLCLLMLAMTSAWADDMKVTWAMGGSTDAVATPDGYATGAITIGDGLSNEGTYTFNEIEFTKFQATSADKGTNGHASAESMNKYVDFSLTPVNGKFTPTKVSFDIIKIGTGDPNIYVDFIDGEGNTVTVADNVVIRKSSESSPSESHSFTVSGAATSENAATLRILVGKLANNKQVGIANVVIEGVWTSSAKTVTFINDANWEKVYVWAWNDEENFTGGTWPGVELTEKDVEGNYIWSTFGSPKWIVFSDGMNQTFDLDFKAGGKYNSTGRIITLYDYSATFKTDGWTDVWAYVWNNDGSEYALGDWPGTKMEGANGEFSIAFKAEEAPAFIIFNNNDGQQTENLVFEDGKAYEYMMNTYTATFKTDTWKDVYAYAWNVDGENPLELCGAYPGQQLSAENGIYTFSIKGFSAPENILFNNGEGGEGNQTIDYKFVDGKAYQYMTATPLYALTEGAVFTAGQTVEVKDGDDVVATITYSEEGGNDFNAATTELGTVEGWAAFAALTTGNETNGNADGGTFYTIKPYYDGTITLAVRLNGGKKFHIAEDGTDLPAYNGWTIPEAINTTYDFDVKAGSTYKIWCDGSKLGFFGFDFKQKPDQAEQATFNFADPNFRENIGESMTDTKGYIYNEIFTSENVSLQITGGSAPSRIFVDNNRGQCLVTYKEYTTLTFRAPSDYVITKIEFTAAGNSNINNFTASSGTIEGMIWTGNASGVRFLQGGTSYLANAIVTLAAADATYDELPIIQYTECENIAAFNALDAGTYAKVHLIDAEIIGKSADGYSTVWIQDATGGAWIQYTSLNDFLQEGNKVNGAIYVIKRVAAGNPQMKEAEDTPFGSIMMGAISSYTTIEGNTIAEVNVPENLNKVVKLSGATLEETSATAGKLTIGEETIDVNNGNETANQALHKIAEWAKDTKLENVTIVAILVAKSATANQLLPISIEIAGETEAGEELNVERYPEMGYTPSSYEVDFTAAKAFLGVEEVKDDMLWIVNPDNTEVGATSTDGWFNTKGFAETWGDLNAEAETADKAGINVKFFQAIPEGTYTICDMNGADVIGNTYTTKWALKANGKTYTYTINVKFVEAPEAGNLTKSDLAIATSVEYTTDEGSYVTKWAKLSDEQVTAICTELGIASLSEATVYGYNPTTGELVSNFAGFDGWRNADGDFQNWTGNAEVPFCIKYSDGQNYECYNIGGLEPQTFKGYWAIANDTKYVLVEIDFIYAEPAPVVLDLTDVMEEITVTYNVTDGDYTEQTVTLSDEQKQAILTAIGLEAFTTGEGDEQVWYADAYVYDPEAKTFAADNSDGWRGIDGLGHNWTGNLDAPFCVQFRGDETFYFYNLQNIEPQTFVTYFAIANSETGKAALLKVNFIYEGTFPHYTVAGAFKVGEEETASFFGTAWDAAAETNDMAHSTENRNDWTLTFEDVELTAGTIFYKVVADHSWDTNWGFDGNNADYVVNMPEGLDKAIFDITFYFSPLGLSNGFNVSCDVVYDEATTVGINSMAASKQNETIYNLQGVRLNKLQKGLNIVGGKKIVVR